jgi:hypothetical protein
VLDDLPSMDDAARRRGRPALHLVTAFATAELAAVALLARAFELVAGSRELAAPRGARYGRARRGRGRGGLLRRDRRADWRRSRRSTARRARVDPRAQDGRALRRGRARRRDRGRRGGAAIAA